MIINLNMHGTDEKHEKIGIRERDHLYEFAKEIGFDTFDVYDVDKFGKAMESLDLDRNKVFYQIKIRPISSFHYSTHYDLLMDDTYSEDRIEKNLDASLSSLNTDYVDAYLFGLDKKNNQDFLNQRNKNKWNILENLYRQGKVNYLGVEHIDRIEYIAELVKHSKIKPSFIQFPHETALKYCLENAIILQLPFSNLDLKDPNITTNLASKYNVTERQITLKFWTKLGAQVLTGGSTKEHITENAKLNFDLNSEEIKEIISNFKNNNEYYSSIYAQIEVGNLMPLPHIINNLSNCTLEKLPKLLAKIEHYIAKLDPFSLAEILSNTTKPLAEFIEILKASGADLNEITSRSYAKIVMNHGEESLDILKDYKVPATKLLLAASTSSDKKYQEILKQSKLEDLTYFDILQISKSHPEILDNLILINIDTEKLLVPILHSGKTELFNNALDRADLSTLAGGDLVQIIKYSGAEIIPILQSKNADFNLLTLKDLNDLSQLENYKDILIALTPFTKSTRIILSAIGGKEFSDELLNKVDAEDLFTKYTKKIVEDAPENLTKLLSHNFDLFYIFNSNLEVEDLFEKVFTIFASNNNTQNEQYEQFLSYYLKNQNDQNFSLLFPKIIEKIDFAKISAYKLNEYLTGLLDKNIQFINLFLKNINLELFNQLDIFSKSYLIEKILESDKPSLAHDIADKIDFKKPLDEKFNYFSSSVSKLISKITEKNDQQLFQILKNKIEFNEIDGFYMSGMLSNIIDIEKNSQWLQELSNKIEFNKLDRFYISNILNQLLEKDNAQLFKIIINKSNFFAKEDYLSENLLRELIIKDKLEIFLNKSLEDINLDRANKIYSLLEKILYSNKIDLFNDLLSRFDLTQFTEYTGDEETIKDSKFNDWITASDLVDKSLKTNPDIFCKALDLVKPHFKLQDLSQFGLNKKLEIIITKSDTQIFSAFLEKLNDTIYRHDVLALILDNVFFQDNSELIITLKEKISFLNNLSSTKVHKLHLSILEFNQNSQFFVNSNNYQPFQLWNKCLIDDGCKTACVETPSENFSGCIEKYYDFNSYEL